MTDTNYPISIAAAAVVNTEEPGGMGVAYDVVLALVDNGLIPQDRQDAAWNETLDVVVPLWKSGSTDKIPQAAVDALRAAGYLT